MGGIFGGGPSMPDNGAADAAAAAERKAKAESDALAKQQADEQDAIKRGLRGSRSLLSGAGGDLGFPGGDRLGG